jgi:hypothetical protein
MMYRKVRFTNNAGGTAGLVLSQEKLDSHTIESLSRLFPVSEARFMRTLQLSPQFPTFDDAFMFEFDEVAR